MWEVVRVCGEMLQREEVYCGIVSYVLPILIA